jgi:hypothetical protein
VRLVWPNLSLYHDVSESFGHLLRETLHDKGGLIGVALGPIYDKDPAEELLFPFIRADVETGWSSKPKFPDGLPEHVISRAKELRQHVVDNYTFGGSWWDGSQNQEREMNDWARAGLVLEVCKRRGVNVRGLGKAHVNWRLKGTETGRFGASHTWNKSSAFPNGFNPLTIPEAERNLVVPSRGGRMVCVIDFRAIDVCSMVALVPGLRRHYEDAWDPHARTAELVFGSDAGTCRAAAKDQIFVHAYGGHSTFKALFDEKLPELAEVRKLPHGEFPRRVQSHSAKAFRAALSEALPLLLGESVIPMFTVHDELVLDVADDSIDRAIDVSNVMQDGATRACGTDYFTSPKFGLTYAEAKKQ